MKTSSISPACCFDSESGLFHLGHFRTVLSQELAKLDRWERPLSLLIIKISGLQGSIWADLGLLARNSLRRIDLAARIRDDLLAIILPDADIKRSQQCLWELLSKLGENEVLADKPLSYGWAVAWPWEGRTAMDLLAMAEADMGRESLESDLVDEEFEDDNSTAIAADERNLLFAGFQALGSRQK